jgi:PilZ domain
VTLQAREAKIETAIDDRRGRRHRLLLEVEARSSESPRDIVTVYDISDTGLLIETSLSLVVGEMIEVNLPHAGFRVAEVVWASGEIFGCEFTQELSPAAISAARLGGSFIAPQTSDPLHNDAEMHANAAANAQYATGTRLPLDYSIWSITAMAIASWTIIGALTYLLLL